MPMLTMSVMVWPVAPRQAPLRTCSEKSRIFSSTALIPGITSAPSTMTGRFDRLRSAVCRTARSSVKLIRAPSNILARQPSTSADRARSSSSRMVSSVTRFLE